MAIVVKPFIEGYAKAFAVMDSTSGKTLLVDAGPSKNSQALDTSLSKSGVSAADVSLILLTHAHPDHTAALEHLQKSTGAPLLCTKQSAAALLDGIDEEIVPRTAFLRFVIGRKKEKSPKNHDPIIAETAIDSVTSLSPWGIDAVAIPTPGHTAGSLSVVTADGEAVIGDLLMKFGPGRPSLSFLANDLTALVAGLRGLLDRGVHTFHLAHGGKVDRGVVEKILAKKA